MPWPGGGFLRRGFQLWQYFQIIQITGSIPEEQHGIRGHTTQIDGTSHYHTTSKLCLTRRMCPSTPSLIPSDVVTLSTLIASSPNGSIVARLVSTVARLGSPNSQRKSLTGSLVSMRSSLPAGCFGPLQETRSAEACGLGTEMTGSTNRCMPNCLLHSCGDSHPKRQSR